MPGNSRVNHGGAFGDGLFLRQGPDACQNDWPRSSSLSSREPAGYTPTPWPCPAPARVPAPHSRPTAPHLAHNARPAQYTATPSGAVSAGSNPAGGTGQRPKFEHSNNLGPTRRQPCELRRCSALPDLAPDTRPESRRQPEKGLLSSTRRQRPQAVTLTADRCSSQYPQLDSGSIGAARARLSSPPGRLDATWPTPHSVTCPLIRRAPRAAYGRLDAGDLLRLGTP